MRPRVVIRAAAAAALCPLAAAALAQTSGGLSITPTLAISQNYTDNADLRSTDKRWEAVTTVSPGVRISSRSGSLQGSLDYALNAQAYANDESRSGFTNQLAAAFTAEVIRQNATVDVRASISQENISAFGVRGADPRFLETNRTEVRSISVAPVLRGRLGDSVSAEARSNWTRTVSTAGGAADSTALVHTGRLFGRLGSRFGWSAEATDVTSDFEGGRESGNRRVSFGLSYTPNPDWQFSLRGGRETDTVRGLDSRSTDNYGGGVVWAPSPRTSVSAQYDKRYFGDGHSVVISHRLRRALISYSDARDVNNGAISDRTLEFVRQYEELFTLLTRIFPTAPPAQVDALVRTELAARGIFIGRAVSLQHSQTLSLALQGVRVTVLMTATQSTSRRLDQASSASDDLSLADGLRQRGYTLTANYTLSPTTSASLGWSSSTHDGSGSSRPDLRNELRTLTASLSGRLARRVSYSLSVRHTSFDDARNPYSENGAQLTVSFSF